MPKSRLAVGMGEPHKFLSETAGELVKLVGYPQIIEALGVSRNTIERAVKDGELPPPRKIKARAVWLASDINSRGRALFEGRLSNLAKSAVTNPDDLSPEQLEGEAVGLVVKSMVKRTGQPVDATDLGIHVMCRITHDEQLEAKQREFAIYSERFADFGMQRACVMSAWLFHSLRPVIEQSVPARDKPMYRDAATIEQFGAAALDDDTWAELMNGLDRK